MGEPALARHLGYPAGAFAERYPGATVRNHEWWDPDTFADRSAPSAPTGSPSSPRAASRQSVDVRLNRAVVEHDVDARGRSGVPA